ncbi:MAG: DUF1684 domain-containing protein [Chloroflexota bacterium]|nr:DUF1684 domain-containing protein [Chloroflexota bacterium]
MPDIAPEDHASLVTAWRAARDARLRDPDGWLTLVGLHWLEVGENHLGAHPANQVVLHGHEIPPRVGSLWVENGQARLVPHAGVEVLHAGKPIGEMLLEDDHDGHPTLLELGNLRFHLIRRGDRLALRVRDATAPELGQFQGMDSFPIDPGWRLVAQLEPAPAEATVEIVDITGSVSRDPTPGTVAFDRDGTTWRIEALPGGEDGSLWLIFGDATNGTDTYAGGRYLYTEPPATDGSVVVDFNLAYNPPCVFSPYATCPLPPAQNRLALRIEAGERRYVPPE